MNRTYRLLLVSLAVLLVIPAEVQAAIGWDLAQNNKFTAVTTLSPNTPLQDVTVTLNGAQAGTMQNPGGPLSASSSLGIVNPGPDGVGTAAFFDVFYTGPTNNFPTDSFFDVFVDITDPGTNLRGRGTVRDIKNDANDPTHPFVVDYSTQLSGSPELLYSLAGHVNPAIQGVIVNGVNKIEGAPLDPNANSFFDIFTELHFNGTGTINPNVPLLEFTLTGAIVPEPATWLLAVVGVAPLLFTARKRQLARS